jgi:NADPH:quinone reductase-like Zn-dependent oxidoreductase
VHTGQLNITIQLIAAHQIEEIPMRAIVQDTFGGPEVLAVADLPEPTPKQGEVLVRVKAAGVNPVDVAVRAGHYPLLGEPPFTIGWDIAGTVEAVGPGVDAFAVGEHVFGMPNFPAAASAYAELVAAPADELARQPDSLGDIEAGALPLAGLTAWQALVVAGGLRGGQQVLVHAGAGGVGHLAVQIAKAKGASVTATASGDKLDFVRGLGADAVIDYREADFTAAVGGMDIVLDPIGGDHLEKSLKVLKPGGVLVSLRDVGEAAQAAAAAKGVRMERISVQPNGGQLAELAGLAKAGKLKVHVAKTFPLERAGEAQEFLATRPIGKIALTP